MDIYDYFYKQKKDTGMEVKDLAKKWGITAPTLSVIMHGRAPPSFKLALKIEKETSGQVTLLEMFDFAQKRNKKPLPKMKHNSGRRKKSSDGDIPTPEQALNVENGHLQGEQLKLNLG